MRTMKGNRSAHVASAGVGHRSAAPQRVLPNPVEAQVQQLAHFLLAEPEVVSVVLLGSAARGELAWAVIDGRLELFSDLEFLVVTARRLPASRRRELSAGLSQLADDFGYRSRLFHVDVLFRERARLATLPPFIFTYELAATGRILAGAEVLGEVRRISLAKLDRCNAHEILFKRLWALAEALPMRWISSGPNALDDFGRRELAVAFYRQPLDVTTVLLPEVGVLRPTYGQRVAAWNEHDLPFRAILDRAVGDDCGRFLSTCLSRRQAALPAEDETAAYRDAVAILTAALAWLLDVPPARVPEVIAQQSRQIFNERPATPGEWLATVRQAALALRRAGPRQAVGWLVGPRKGLLTAGLVHLHRALLAHQARQPRRAEAELQRARRVVASISFPPEQPEAGGVRQQTFPLRWQATRALLGRIFWRTIRLGEPAAWQHIARLIDWPENNACRY